MLRKTLGGRDQSPMQKTKLADNIDLQDTEYNLKRLEANKTLLSKECKRMHQVRKRILSNRQSEERWNQYSYNPMGTVNNWHCQIKSIPRNT
jgi:hypothetical protein